MTTRYDNRAAYIVDEAGLLTPTTVATLDGAPVDNYGMPLVADGRDELLAGWAHGRAASYNDGRVLVPYAMGTRRVG